jgi:hypothetical protein
VSQFVIEHPEFAFYLPGDWQAVPASAEHQLELVSVQNESRITLSILMLETPEDGLDAYADQLLRMRDDAHKAWLTLPENAGKGRTYVVTSEKRRTFPEYKSVEVTYTGQYPGFSMFGFVGYVTPRKVVSMFCETKYSFAPGRAGVFQTVANGFKNTLP